MARRRPFRTILPVETPARKFNVDPSRRVLVAADQNSDNLAVLRIDPVTGQLSPTGSEIAVSEPVCVLFW